MWLLGVELKNFSRVQWRKYDTIVKIIHYTYSCYIGHHSMPMYSVHTAGLPTYVERRSGFSSHLVIALSSKRIALSVLEQIWKGNNTCIIPMLNPVNQIILENHCLTCIRGIVSNAMSAQRFYFAQITRFILVMMIKRETMILGPFSYYFITVNWLLFVMYQFSQFLSVPAMTKLRPDQYKYTYTIDYLKPIL